MAAPTPTAPTFATPPPRSAVLPFSSEQRGAFSVAPPEKRTAYECWDHNLSVHYAFDVDVVQPTLPSGLLVDAYPDAAGVPRAWVTVWLFEQVKTRSAWMPAMFGATFPDLHVHTPVRDENGTFFSHFNYRTWVDNRLAAAAGRSLYGAPMFHAHQHIACDDAGRGSFRSDKGEDHRLRAAWQVGARIERGSSFLERDAFLHDRYEIMFTHDGKRSRVRNTKPWMDLYEAAIDEWEVRLDNLPFAFPAQPDYATYAKKIEVDVYDQHSF